MLLKRGKISGNILAKGLLNGTIHARKGLYGNIISRSTIAGSISVRVSLIGSIQSKSTLIGTVTGIGQPVGRLKIAQTSARPPVEYIDTYVLVLKDGTHIRTEVVELNEEVITNG